MYKKRKDMTIIVIVLEKGILVSWQVITYHELKINMRKLNLAVKVELAAYQIHKTLIYPEQFADNIKRRLSNKMTYSKEIIVLGRPQFRSKS